MSQEIFVYTTATRQKELFVPINKTCVKIYSCGPTVYSDPHIGNMRAYVFADILRQTLKYVGGYTVEHITNITDVGHLTDDGDQGEDKMEKGARREKKTVWEVARMYEEHFLAYSDALAIERFDAYPRATEHIKEQIIMVQQLVDKGFTYEIPGDGVYMDTSKVNDYGKLAQLDIEGMQSHHRGEGAIIDSTKKKQITDFALWKFSPQGEKRVMERESPRGIGFPGRHIECSAMAIAHLGERIDIHTGGIDHIPVHHTNEIAQAECALDIDQWVNYRMHCQFLQIDGSKVSKSKGDDLSIPAIIETGYDPLDLRYFYMTGHYRSFLDFTWEALRSAKTTRKNIIKKMTSIYKDIKDVEDTTGLTGPVYEQLSKALADDLDTVRALTIIHETMTDLTHITEQDIFDILRFDDEILKLGLRVGIKEKLRVNDIPDEIRTLRDEYIVVKETKQYDRADEIRNELNAEGWMITLKNGIWIVEHID